MKRRNGTGRVRGNRKGDATSGRVSVPGRRVKHALALGSLVVFSKIVEESFDDLQVVHVEQQHPIPRWWWITTALMAAALMAGVKWLAIKMGFA